jgi:hypothetical protein
LDSPFFFDGTIYWSEGDEQAHFDWLSRIGCIRDVRGSGTRIYLAVERGAVSGNDLRELQAIYRRYDGDLTQLTILEEGANARNQ